MTLPRRIELRWQRDVIERWLSVPELPLDARAGLLEMLKLVEAELEELDLQDSDEHRHAS